MRAHLATALTAINTELDKVDEIIMDKLDFDKQLTSDEMEAVDHNFLAWRTLNVK